MDTTNDVTKHIKERLEKLQDEAAFLSSMSVERNELFAVCAFLMERLGMDTLEMSLEDYEKVRNSSIFITPDYENKTLGIQVFKNEE